MAAFASEVTALEKHHASHAGTIDRAKALKGMDASLHSALHGFVEGTADNFLLMLAGKLIEVNCIARNSDC